MILGFDPGKDKCGIAVIDNCQKILFHQVVKSEDAIATINSLCLEYQPKLIVMGNQTTSQIWKQQLETKLNLVIPIVMIDEKNSTLEARSRYWQMYPPKGLTRLIPKGLRIPPRPIDDIVAIILIERLGEV